MIKLNLPEYQLNIRNNSHKEEVFDSIRKKYVALTPEEWVRQNFILYLTNEKKYPASLITVEKGLKLNSTYKRADIVIFDSKAHARIIVECKAPKVKITQETFNQAARYNITLKVDYLIITNGLNHYCCRINLEDKSINFLKDIPDYKDINL
ncbi:MAG: restriction endonuclease subunit R [Bacteroidetes bacterium CG2_30_33_31]|nr:MAG: restriction endonuclease subunit R [Bacteroidetes bacterium CG2_30_33_31]